MKYEKIEKNFNNWLRLAQIRCCYSGVDSAHVDFFNLKMKSDFISTGFKLFNSVGNNKNFRSDLFFLLYVIPLKDSKVIRFREPRVGEVFREEKLKNPEFFLINNRSIQYRVKHEMYEIELLDKKFLKPVSLENVNVHFSSYCSTYYKKEYGTSDFSNSVTYQFMGDISDESYRPMGLFPWSPSVEDISKWPYD